MENEDENLVTEDENLNLASNKSKIATGWVIDESPAQNMQTISTQCLV